MPKAKYEGIYHSIKKRIEAQDYPYQSLLPSENTLIEEYACSRNTVRRALAELIAEKRTLHLPKILKNVIHCKNPRCITSIEQELPHIFYLDDKDHEVYRCRYCDEKHS